MFVETGRIAIFRVEEKKKDMQIEIVDDYKCKTVSTREVTCVESVEDLINYLKEVEKIAIKKGWKTTWIRRVQLIIYKPNQSYSITKV